MEKSIFQKIYDWIGGLKTPTWLKVFLQEIQDMIIIALIQIGKDYLTGLQAKVLEVNGLNIPSEQKFEIVFKWGKDNIPNIKDSVLNLLIEIIVNKIKAYR